MKFSKDFQGTIIDIIMKDRFRNLRFIAPKNLSNLLKVNELGGAAMKIHFNYFSQEYFRLRLFITFFIFSGLLCFAYATNHYVDKNANGSNNGTSWTNAWTSFSSINWGTIQPGDNIYISGGTDSTVYNESMTIGKSGAAGNLITVRNGLDAGHNGKVVIDRNYASGNSGAIEIWNQKYLRVAGITIRKVVGSGIYLRGQSTNALKNVYVDSCDISDFRGQGGVYVSGYGNSGNARDYVDSVFIRYNTITTLTYGNYQTDCIYVQYQKSAFVVGNVIHQRNTYNPSQHCDGVQSSDAVNLVVADNYIDLINDNGEANQPDQGIIIGRMTGVVEVYNNIVYTPYLDGYSNSVLVGMASTGTWDIYGNTIVSYTNSNLMKFDLPTSGYVKNNIFYSQRSSAAVIYPSGLAASHIDNNLYYYTTGNTVVSNRGTLSQMRAAGAEINGMNTNPSFINPSGNWRLDPGSSAINAGYTLGNPYNVDMVGVPRPQGSGYDMGAYEYVAGGGNLPPSQPSNPNPVNAAINQPVSLTLTWSCSDPNGDPLTYDVYFGTSSNPSLVSGNQSSASYNPGQLNNSATYYWKIIAKDNHGNSTSGPVWNFATITGIINNPPNQPSNPNPVNAAINQPISLTLTWSCSDPDGDPLTYDIYFGTSSNPSLVSGNQSNASYNPGQLNNSTTYYWKIVAKDNQDSSTTGPVWSFSTEAAGGGSDNIPPELSTVQIVQTDQVVLDFSEPLDTSSALNTNNYNISNQVQVTGVEISPSHKRICLNTTNHDTNFVYSITVNNITDTAGNVINSQANSAFYKLLDISSVAYKEYLVDLVNASSTSDTNTSPQKTLDGLGMSDPDPNSRWASQPMPQWIQYDLGSTKIINLIAASFYNWNGGRIYHYSIETSDDSVQWNEVVSNASSSSQEWTLNEFTSLNARFVRILCLDNNQVDWAGLWETRVFGPDSVTPVEFSSLTAKANDGDVSISWITSTEINNQSFMVERKKEEGNFSDIGSVPGNGTTTKPHSYNYIDKSVSTGKYYYRIKQVDLNGLYSYSNTINVEVDWPKSFTLEQNYPNPFNPATNICFSVPEESFITLKVYDILGNEVSTLVNEKKAQGNYTLKFNAVNLPSGIYFERIQAIPIGRQTGSFTDVKKMILLK